MPTLQAAEELQDFLQQVQAARQKPLGSKPSPASWLAGNAHSQRVLAVLAYGLDEADTVQTKLAIDTMHVSLDLDSCASSWGSPGCVLLSRYRTERLLGDHGQPQTHVRGRQGTSVRCTQSGASRSAGGTGWSRRLPARQGPPGRMRAAACHDALQAVGRSASVGQALDLLQDLGVWRLHEQRSLIKAGVVEHFPPDVMVRAAPEACSCARLDAALASPSSCCAMAAQALCISQLAAQTSSTHVSSASSAARPLGLLAAPGVPALVAVTFNITGTRTSPAARRGGPGTQLPCPAGASSCTGAGCGAL